MNKESLIEKYFSNQLSEKEFEQLQQLLQEDSELREEFCHELEIKNTITQEKHAFLKNRFQKLDKKPVKKTPWYLYAAAIAILIAIGALFFDTAPDYHKLYAENFEVYPNVVNITTRSDVQSENEETEAFTLYEAKKFNKAANTFQDLYRNNEKDYLKFYEGVSLLADNKTSEGIKVLQSYNWEDKQSDFAIPAFWYLGLSYIKVENTPDANKYLKKVTRSGHPLSATAKELLEKLN